MSITRTSTPNDTIGLFQSEVEIGKGANACSPYLINFSVSKATIRVEPEVKAGSAMVIIRLIDALVFGYEPPTKRGKE